MEQPGSLYSSTSSCRSAAGVSPVRYKYDRSSASNSSAISSKIICTEDPRASVPVGARRGRNEGGGGERVEAHRPLREDEDAVPLVAELGE